MVVVAVAFAIAVVSLVYLFRTTFHKGLVTLCFAFVSVAVTMTTIVLNTQDPCYAALIYNLTM